MGTSRILSRLPAATVPSLTTVQASSRASGTTSLTLPT